MPPSRENNNVTDRTAKACVFHLRCDRKPQTATWAGYTIKIHVFIDNYYTKKLFKEKRLMVSLPKIDKMLIPLQGHLVLEYEKNRPSGLGGVCEQTDTHTDGLTVLII